MNSIREIIVEEIKKLGLAVEASDLERPKDLKNGDFSFFVKDKEVVLEKLPLEKIAHEYIEKVSIFGRFINFHLTQKFFVGMLEQIIEFPQTFGKNYNLADKKIIIEFTDPNPFKEFHIGHLMSNTIGESISRIVEWSGAEVSRANYQGDVGPQIAKAVWGIRKLGLVGGHGGTKNTASRAGASTSFISKIIAVISFGKKPGHDTETMDGIGKAYALASSLYETDEGVKNEIKEINKKIYDRTDPDINDLYDWGRKVSLDHFERIYKKLGTKFVYYFFESQTAPIGLFIVEELLAKGILERSDGAVVFKGEQYDLHTRVFVNSQGLPTYEAKELGLAKAKFDRADFDHSVVITGNEQTEYYKVFLKVLEFADHRAANRTWHIGHGMLRFAEGKMSSRKGNVITGESLIADVEKLVEEKVKDRDLPADEKREIAEQVAVAAIKYSILKQSPGRDIIFDFAKSLSFEGDSGPYLQYTHARMCSLLQKAKTEKIVGSLSRAEAPGELEHLIARFPDIVVRAQKEYAPQLIATYLINLASAFNHYYAEHKILDQEHIKISEYRLALTEAVKNVLQNGLHLLGIKAPERM